MLSGDVSSQRSSIPLGRNRIDIPCVSQARIVFKSYCKRRHELLATSLQMLIAFVRYTADCEYSTFATFGLLLLIQPDNYAVWSMPETGPKKQT